MNNKPNNKLTLLTSLVIGATSAGCEFGFEDHGHEENLDEHGAHVDAHDHAPTSTLPLIAEVPPIVRQMIDTALQAAECGNGTTKSLVIGDIFSFPAQYYTQKSNLILCKNSAGLTHSIAAYGRASQDQLTTLQSLTKSEVGYVSVSRTDTNPNLYIQQVDLENVKQNGTFDAITRSVDLIAKSNGNCEVHYQDSQYTISNEAQNCQSYLAATAQRLYGNWNGNSASTTVNPSSSSSPNPDPSHHSDDDGHGH